MMGGFVARTFNNIYYALEATHPADAALAQSYAEDTWDWMISKGIWPENRALFLWPQLSGM